MKLFFVASIHGKERYAEQYDNIVEVVEELGHTIEADHVLGTTSDQIANWDEEKDIDFHHKVLDGVKKSDIVIAELSYSSTSVGYLVSVAVETGKPTIALYGGEEKPHLLQTLTSDEKFQVINYTDIQSLRTELKFALEYAADQQDTRFNFFISPKQQAYLDWIAKHRKVPRAVFLRKLIEKDMEENPDY